MPSPAWIHRGLRLKACQSIANLRLLAAAGRSGSTAKHPFDMNSSTHRIKTLSAFVVLLLLHAELHELAHVLPGAAICGSFGQRDFNAWSLSEGCTSIVPTVLGPVFTFSVAFLAAWISRHLPPSQTKRVLLVLASTTLLGRVFTAVLGGGDELQVMRQVSSPTLLPHAQAVTVFALAALSLWPALVAYRALDRRLGRLLLWSVAPFLFLVAFVLLGANSLLQIEALATPLILGSPPVVHLYTAVILLLAPFAWRSLR